MSNKLENGKDKVVGKLKETAGKWMDDEELEFQGKVQGIKGDIGDKADRTKDKIIGKANDAIDKTKVNNEGKNKK